MYTEDGGEIVNPIEGDSQCPTCGSVVMSDEITLPKTSMGEEYVLGFVCGIIGALACAIVLILAGAIQLSV